MCTKLDFIFYGYVALLLCNPGKHSDSFRIRGSYFTSARITNSGFVSVGARGSVFPGAVSVPHGAGEGGGDGGRHQERHPPGPAHLLLHLLVAG